MRALLILLLSLFFSISVTFASDEITASDGVKYVLAPPEPPPVELKLGEKRKISEDCNVTVGRWTSTEFCTWAGTVTATSQGVVEDKVSDTSVTSTKRFEKIFLGVSMVFMVVSFLMMQKSRDVAFAFVAAVAFAAFAAAAENSNKKVFNSFVTLHLLVSVGGLIFG